MHRPIVRWPGSRIAVVASVTSEYELVRYFRFVKPYPIVDVSDWDVVQEEPGGETAKDWLKDPETGTTWLFKSVTLKELADGRAYRRGQDWAEKVASELAHSLGLPAATVELARRNEVPGLISRDLKSEETSLDEAADFLAELDEKYVPWTAGNKIKNRVGHSLTNVLALLEEVAAPPESEGVVAKMTAQEVFVGYLYFDALISNVDRHDRNWAIVRTESGRRCLSATYDHGSALGSGLDEDRRIHHAADVPGWCRNGFAQRFEAGHRTTLPDLAAEFAANFPHAREYWKQQIAGLKSSDIADIVHGISVMSELERTFVLEVVTENQRRIQL